jgi:hypothetical protein
MNRSDSSGRGIILGCRMAAGGVALKGRQSTRGLALIALSAMWMSACSAPATDIGQEHSPRLVAATPEPTASLRPTASPTADVETALVDLLTARPDRLKATLIGTFRVGEEQVPVSGTYRANGADFHVELEFDGAAPAGSVEQIARRGRNYTRSDGGRWMRTDNASKGADLGLGRLLGAASSFQILGTERVGGQTLTRVKPTDLDVPLVISRLGLIDLNSEVARGSIELLVTQAGEPVHLIVEAELKQSAGSVTVTSTWDLEYTFVRIGGQVTIKQPMDAWRIHTAVDLWYVVLYPDEWTFSEESNRGRVFHLFAGPGGQEAQVVLFTELDGVTPEDWFAESADLLEQQFGVQPLEKPISLGGREARLFALHTVDHGQRYLFLQAVILGDGLAWDISWWSFAGNEASDEEQFGQILSTFTPLQPPPSTSPP